jgi:hypothetical protein
MKIYAFLGRFFILQSFQPSSKLEILLSKKFFTFNKPMLYLKKQRFYRLKMRRKNGKFRRKIEIPDSAIREGVADPRILGPETHRILKQGTIDIAWIDTALRIVLLQCMGEMDVTVTDKLGNKRQVRIYRDKSVLTALKYLASLHGHKLQEELEMKFTANINQQMNINHHVEFNRDAGRTAEIASILAECGAFQPEIDGSANPKVVRLHSA